MAKLHGHISNRRSDILCKLSIRIIWENDIVCIKDLMPKNHRLARFIFEGTKLLLLQEWTCPMCGAVYDRNSNAAKKILKEGFLFFDVAYTYGRAGHVQTRMCGKTM